jgi:outer membrane receptor for ferrienterochelin and colicin
MGNANLKPEKNIAYELGLQQELAVNWGLQLTVYYKDIKNLLGQEIINTVDKKVYARYINRDYGNVKGITLALEKGMSDNFGGSVDYTYQVAKGNASDPNSVFADFQSNPPRESEKQVLPLDWDQRHTINMRLNIGNPQDWNMGIIGRFATGQPYTPSNPGSALTTQFENSGRKPAIYNIDLNIYKKIQLLGFKVKLFCKIYNLLDRLNEKRVYSSTGTAEFPYRTNAEREILEANPNFSVKQIDLRPDFYTQPRRVLLGFSVNF